MAVEIEWKFLVTHLPALPDAPYVDVVQGYLSQQGASVRVRIAGDEGYLTVKGSPQSGHGPGTPVARMEFEYRVPLKDAEEMMTMAGLIIQKRRYFLPNHVELDVFCGEHEGFVMAEVEVEGEGPMPDAPPGWHWRDVSSDRRYANRAIAENGFPADAEKAIIGE